MIIGGHRWNRPKDLFIGGDYGVVSKLLRLCMGNQTNLGQLSSAVKYPSSQYTCVCCFGRNDQQTHVNLADHVLTRHTAVTFMHRVVDSIEFW